jgi:hypothetical protein
VYGARVHRMLRIPYFSVVYDGNNLHVTLDRHHLRLERGHVGMIRGFTSKGQGTFYVAELKSPDDLEEMRKCILALAMTREMQENTPLE